MHSILYLILAAILLGGIIVFPPIIVAYAIVFWIYETFTRPKYSDIRTPTPVSTDKPSGQFMSAAAKKAYLNSDEWQTKRLARFHIDNHQCLNCSSTANLECHHTTYKRLGKENVRTDLATLCNNCHSRLHEKLGYDRSTEYPISPLKD